MRSVQVSTEVFAAIWAARQRGEESEDAILRRVLKTPEAPAPEKPNGSLPTAVGFIDLRYGVHLPEGFLIERTYKGNPVKARAAGGGWKLEKTGEVFPTLRALGEALNIATENAWANWFYRDHATGERKPISLLRDQSKIITRSKQ